MTSTNIEGRNEEASHDHHNVHVALEKSIISAAVSHIQSTTVEVLDHLFTSCNTQLIAALIEQASPRACSTAFQLSARGDELQTGEFCQCKRAQYSLYKRAVQLSGRLSSDIDEPFILIRSDRMRLFRPQIQGTSPVLMTFTATP